MRRKRDLFKSRFVFDTYIFAVCFACGGGYYGGKADF